MVTLNQHPATLYKLERDKISCCGIGKSQTHRKGPDVWGEVEGDALVTGHYRDCQFTTGNFDSFHSKAAQSECMSTCVSKGRLRIMLSTICAHVEQQKVTCLA